MQIAEKELDILGTEEGQNLSTKWRRDDEGDEDEEEEEDDGEDEWKKTEEKNEINDECPKMRRSRSKSEEVEEEDTSSSEVLLGKNWDFLGFLKILSVILGCQPTRLYLRRRHQ